MAAISAAPTAIRVICHPVKPPVATMWAVNGAVRGATAEVDPSPMGSTMPAKAEGVNSKKLSKQLAAAAPMVAARRTKLVCFMGTSLDHDTGCV
jgi:hypothetical protein